MDRYLCCEITLGGMYKHSVVIRCGKKYLPLKSRRYKELFINQYVSLLDKLLYDIRGNFNGHISRIDIIPFEGESNFWLNNDNEKLMRGMIDLEQWSE